MPTVSVIIPTYNRRAYVQEAIDSVLAQTYTTALTVVFVGETILPRWCFGGPR